jgi:hypothetical protein
MHVPIWPASLVTELSQRRCIVFLGAGITASCKNGTGQSPPRWKELLEKAGDRVTDAAAKKAAAKLIKRGQYLDAAEVIFSVVNAAERGALLREVFTTPRFTHSKLHQYILKLDAKIVVTTNYDQVYEDYCRSGAAANAYRICRQHDDNFIDLIRAPEPVIVKAHGCMSATSHTVLTRRDYFENRKQYSAFYRVLDALFLTHTLLFIGYSMSDPDIQLVLENANISAPSQHPHYVLTDRSRERAIDAAIEKACNVQMLYYPKGRHEHVESALEDLSQQVEQQLVRGAGVVAPAPVVGPGVV